MDGIFAIKPDFAARDPHPGGFRTATTSREPLLGAAPAGRRGIINNSYGRVQPYGRLPLWIHNDRNPKKTHKGELTKFAEFHPGTLSKADQEHFEAQYTTLSTKISNSDLY